VAGAAGQRAAKRLADLQIGAGVQEVKRLPVDHGAVTVGAGLQTTAALAFHQALGLLGAGDAGQEGLRVKQQAAVGDGHHAGHNRQRVFAVAAGRHRAHILVAVGHIIDQGDHGRRLELPHQGRAGLPQAGDEILNAAGIQAGVARQGGQVAGSGRRVADRRGQRVDARQHAAARAQDCHRQNQHRQTP